MNFNDRKITHSEVLSKFLYDHDVIKRLHCKNFDYEVRCKVSSSNHDEFNKTVLVEFKNDPDVSIISDQEFNFVGKKGYFDFSFSIRFKDKNKMLKFKLKNSIV